MAERTRAETTELPDGTRVIEKPDGHVITIAPGGETMIRKPDGTRITRLAGGAIHIESPDGAVVERGLQRATPRDERPLNVVSHSGEEIGRLMSNFADAPFVLDGRCYTSVESFYVSLLFLDRQERAAIARLSGREAKRAGRASKLAHTTYASEEFELGSPAHHALIKRAIRAKLALHPAIARDFAATAPRPIVHDTGRPEHPTTRLPGVVFHRMLTELRDELLRQAVVDPTG